MIYILDDVSQTQVSRFNIKKDPGLHVSFRESRFCLEKKVFILNFIIFYFDCNDVEHILGIHWSNKLTLWFDLT